MGKEKREIGQESYHLPTHLTIPPLSPRASTECKPTIREAFLPYLSSTLNLWQAAPTGWLEGFNAPLRSPPPHRGGGRRSVGGAGGGVGVGSLRCP